MIDLSLAKPKDEFPLHQYHMNFLGVLRELWPLMREKNRLMHAGDHKAVERLDVIQAEKVMKAEGWLKKILILRIYRSNAYLQDLSFKDKQDKICAGDFINWINNFAYTYDPRLAPLGLPSSIPMILWPAQEAFLRQVDQFYRSKASWLGDKSRGWGATWLICVYYMWHFIYTAGFVGGFGSRKEELVDRTGDPSTIFWKLRHILYNLPKNMRPDEMLEVNNRYDNNLRLINPVNGSAIIGEGGDNMGAGGRTSMYVIDEKALVERADKVDAAVSFNTDCQGDISTPRGMNHFGQKRWEGKVHVLTMHWYMDPAKNEDYESGRRPENNDWYEYQKEMRSKVVIAQEVDIDYQASVEGIFIPAEWVRAAVDFDIPEGDELIAGLDLAGTGGNESVYVLRRGSVVVKVLSSSYNTITEAGYWAIDMADDDKVALLNYDLDGVGQSLYGILETSERKFKFRYNGIHSNDGASDRLIASEGKRAKEKFLNKRAEMWWGLRERFRKTYEVREGVKIYPVEECISIPDDDKLIKQLSSPLMKYTSSGKIAVESKKELRSRNIGALDRADATVYAYDEYETFARVGDRFDVEFMKDIDKDDRVGSDTYVSLVVSKDLITSLIVARWLGRGVLQVLHEYTESNAQPHEVAEYVGDVCGGVRLGVREWLANDEVFKEMETGGGLWYLYRRAGVTLRQNYAADKVGNVVLMNKMFDAGMIQIDLECEALFHQVREWRKDSRGEYGLAKALALLVSRLRVKKLVTAAKVEKRLYGRKAEAA